MPELNPEFYQHNVTGVVDLIKYANALSGGTVVMGFILVLWFIIFAKTIGQGVEKAFSFASWFAFIVTVIFIALQVLEPILITIPLLLLGISGLLIWFNKE